MTISEAKRRADNKWAAKNLTVLGCKARKEKAETFKRLCAENGTTVNAVFTEAMNTFIAKHGGES